MRVTLRPYQAEALDKVRDAEARGVRRQLLVAATGLGKEQPVDEPVLTPTGWVPIGSLVPGDRVIGSDGKPTAVLGVFPQGRRPVLRVTTSDGGWARCGPDHLWLVRPRRDRRWRTWPARGVRARQHVPALTAPVELIDRGLPVDPYTLGRIITAESVQRTAWDLGVRPGLLDEMGLWAVPRQARRVPDEYLTAGTGARLALLRGLMDTGGHVLPFGCEFMDPVQPVVDAVAELARSLGANGRPSGRMPRPTMRGYRFQAPFCPFRDSEWAQEWAPETLDYRIIRSVEPDGRAEQVCIQVEAPDGLYVTRHHLLTHNTVMFCALAEQRRERTLILAHRDELIEQAAGKVREVWPDADVGVVKAERNETHADVVVASVQTLARRNRLDRLPSIRWAGADRALFGVGGHPFGLVVVDEAHHSAADSYRRILDHLAAGEDGGPLLLGVTATPDRGDGKGLDGTFDEIVATYDILWGIRAGYLSDLRGIRVQLDRLDLASVKVSRGDYQAGAAGQALEDADAPRLIASAWLEHALGRRTLVFTPTVATAQQVAAEFTRAGVRAAWVSGETPTDERRAILAAYDAGEIDVVANCAVLTEGFDSPRTDCIVMARPTRSRALYTQCVGRGTRRHPDKTDCLVLDVVGATAQHSLVTVPSLFGLPEGRVWAGEAPPVAETVAAFEAEEVAAGRLRAEEVELFATLRRSLAWVATHEPGEARRYVLSIGGRDRIVLAQTDDSGERWAAQAQRDQAGALTLVRDVTMEMAQGVAEDFARREGSTGLVDPQAAWRARPPTARQLTAARKWRLPAIASYGTAGELSDALTAHIERRRQRQEGAR